MATADLTASQVILGVAALMNDVNQNVYNDAVVIPYLNIALQELQEEFELNNVPVTDAATSDPINIPAGATSIAFNTTPPDPKLPDDLIEPQILWQRTEGIDPYIQMFRADNLPKYMEGVETSSLGVYVWQSQEIRFLPASADIDIKIDYIRNLFSPIIDGSSTINVINAQTFLQHRTGGLCAQFIGENPGRAQELNSFATASMDRVLGIGAKGRQAFTTRRRPFRSGYKQRW